VQFELRPHQVEALKKMKNGCILNGGVGVGKSYTAVAYYIEREAPKDVYVITTAKKRDDMDWRHDFLQADVGISRDATFHGVLTVDSWNNITKYKDVKGAFFIFDEQRLVGSGSWAKSFIRIARNNNWILLSATPGDNWMDYIPVFIANGFYKNRTHFTDSHVIFSTWSKFPKVERYVEEGKLIRLRSELLVHMPYVRHTNRKTVDVRVKFDREKFDQVLKNRWNPYEDAPVKDISELFRLMRKIAYSDPSRLEMVREIMKKHPRLIIFYNFDYELETLRSLAEEGLTIAEWNGHKHEDVPETERWLYLVQYVAGAEGWNCITTDAMIFHSLTYSYKNWHQAHGRTDRLNTPFSDLYYYVLKSESVIDLAVWKSLKAKQNFNESGFVKKS
jgi:hypothetical protein